MIDHPFFMLTVIRAPLDELARRFDAYPAMRVRSAAIPLTTAALAPRPDGRDPLLLWTPRAAPGLSVGLGCGGYVASYSVQFGFDVIELRSTAPGEPDAVNEFVAHAGGRRIRVVQALRDSPRWVFYEDGERLAFEAVERYGARFVRDRLVREQVLDYAQAWGVPLRDADCWVSDRAALTFVPRTPDAAALEAIRAAGRVPCARCGDSTHPDTARRNDGLCTPCARGVAR